MSRQQPGPRDGSLLGADPKGFIFVFSTEGAQKWNSETALGYTLLF